MAKARIEKVVSQLPATLEKNTVYYVRVGNGFDIYLTNNAGVATAYTPNYWKKTNIAGIYHALNSDIDVIIAKENNTAQRLLAGGFATTDSFDQDRDKIPLNGGYFKGVISANSGIAKFVDIGYGRVNKRTYPASYSVWGAPTGAIIFELPELTNGALYNTHIEISAVNAQYANLYQKIQIELYGAGYSKALLTNDTGAPDILTRFRFGFITATGKYCLILNDVSSIWEYPQINIDSYTGGNTGVALGEWKSYVLTDLSGITIDHEVAIESALNKSNLLNLSLTPDKAYGISNGSDSRTNKYWFDYNWANSGYAGSVLNFSGFNGGYSTEIFASYNNPNEIGIRVRQGDGSFWHQPRWLWHKENFNPANYQPIGDYVPVYGNTTIWGTKTFSGLYTAWRQGDGYATGFAESRTDSFRSGTLDNYDYRIYRNSGLVLEFRDNQTLSHQRLTINKNAGGTGQNLGSVGNNSLLQLANYGSYGTNFWTVDSGAGNIQQQRFDGLEQAYALNLQPLGGLLTYNGEEIAKKSWVNSQLNNYVLASTVPATLANYSLLANQIDAVSVTGNINKIITLTKHDGSVLQAVFVDNDTTSPDDVINTLNFNTSTGVLTAVTSEGATITVSVDGRYSLLNHGHNISDVSGLQGALDGKSNVGHGHGINDVAGLQGALNNKIDSGFLVNRQINDANIADNDNGIAFHYGSGANLPAGLGEAVLQTYSFLPDYFAAQFVTDFYSEEHFLRTQRFGVWNAPIRFYSTKHFSPDDIIEWNFIAANGATQSWVNGQIANFVSSSDLSYILQAYPTNGNLTIALQNYLHANLAGAVNGVATLDDTGKLHPNQRPTAAQIGAVPVSAVGVPNGLATLDSFGILRSDQRPTPAQLGAIPDTHIAAGINQTRVDEWDEAYAMASAASRETDIMHTGNASSYNFDDYGRPKQMTIYIKSSAFFEVYGMEKFSRLIIKNSTDGPVQFKIAGSNTITVEKYLQHEYSINGDSQIIQTIFFSECSIIN